ncbi:hypothetical protein J2T57_000021 [Natronocella acetinitrilica]|uniref:Uncharacterized protein n=1 Tax=Natronocella acetinitrilica TaxID=414046 RepID=A0AAE3G103_9GAMM|nr:hypothetical protein [Natronocella acetinitrilica]MCP1672929.1 hypothetical protein [Natronocella acetinitrilica]
MGSNDGVPVAHILGAFLECAAGDTLPGLLAQTMTGESCLRREPELALHAPGHDKPVTPLVGRIRPNEGSPRNTLPRCLHLLLPVIERALAAARDRETPVHHIAICVPESLASQEAAVMAALTETGLALPECAITLHTVGGSGATLSGVVETLATTGGECALFAGVDSLVSLAAVQRHLIGADPDNRHVTPPAVGEGAVCLLLGLVENEGDDGLARITAVGLGNADGPLQTSLFASVEKALDGQPGNGVPPPAMIHAAPQGPDYRAALYRAEEQFWPRRLSPREQLATRKGRPTPPPSVLEPEAESISLARLLGDTGAAALPLALALACARLRHPTLPGVDALVVDAGPGRAGTAVHLARPNTHDIHFKEGASHVQG